jgi:MoxR-like ATPase
MLFSSPTDALESLRAVGYITDMKTASTVYLAGFLNKPIILEGLAGAGKTELAMAISRARNLPIFRLQCYEGITSNQVIGEIDKNLQNLYMKVSEMPFLNIESQEWAALKTKFNSKEFFRAGPILRAFENPGECLLLIDEIDKVDKPMEAMLLEALSAWALSIHELGTIRATTIPTTILTSNEERALGFALRRRSLYLRVDFPTPAAEARIVALHTANLSPAVHLYISMLALELRSQRFEKQPSIAEMIDIAKTMGEQGREELTLDDQDVYMPLFAKTPKDVERLTCRTGAWGEIISGTRTRLIHAEAAHSTHRTTIRTVTIMG